MYPTTMLWIGLCCTVLAPSLAIPTTAHAQAEAATASTILQAVDQNLQSDTQRSTVAMTVTTPRRTRTYDMTLMTRGPEASAIEYLSPSRDKGTKMLKLGDQMWMYLPVLEREQQISGHMLRQGISGSDVSYEDMMAASDLSAQYEATLIGAEDVDGRPCHKLELTARDDTVAYPRRLSWVDKEYNLPLKQELFALSGMLLKTWIMTDIQAFDDGRFYPMKMVIADKVQEGTSTSMMFSDMTFGIELADETFSKRWLSRN